MSHGLNMVNEEQRSAVAQKRIKLNGKFPGMGTLAALDWLGKPEQKKGHKRRR